MKFRILLLTCFMAIGALWANARNTSTGTTADTKKDVNGTVFSNITRKPLSNVSITAYSSTKKEKAITTDESGTFYFDDLKPGIYKFVFEKEGFKKVTKEKMIHTDETFQLNIEMVEKEDFEFVPGTFHF